MDKWISPNSGDWNDPVNWSTGHVPGPADDAVINVSGASPTVTVDSAESVHSLTAVDPLVISGATLDVAASSTISGPLTFNGGGLEVDGGTTQINGGPVTSTGTGSDLRRRTGSDLDLTGGHTVTYAGSSRGLARARRARERPGHRRHRRRDLQPLRVPVPVDRRNVRPSVHRPDEYGHDQRLRWVEVDQRHAGLTRAQIAVDSNSYLGITGHLRCGGRLDHRAGYLFNCVLDVTASPAAATTILMEGTGDTLETDNLANTTLWVQGNGYINQNATLTVADGLTNDGTILLESHHLQLFRDAGHWRGTFTNAADGTIQVAAGTGGGRAPSPAPWSTRARSTSISTSRYLDDHGRRTTPAGGSITGPGYLYNTPSTSPPARRRRRPSCWRAPATRWRPTTWPTRRSGCRATTTSARTPP